MIKNCMTLSKFMKIYMLYRHFIKYWTQLQGYICHQKLPCTAQTVSNDHWQGLNDHTIGQPKKS